MSANWQQIFASSQKSSFTSPDAADSSQSSQHTHTHSLLKGPDRNAVKTGEPLKDQMVGVVVSWTKKVAGAIGNAQNQFSGAEI